GARTGPRPVADFLEACLGAGLARQGFATADVLLAWPDIVGERLAAFTQPVKLEWRRKAPHADPEAPPEPATLVVRCESAFALEMQHLAPIAIERVNAYYGWRCVGRIALRQGPAGLARGRPQKRPSLNVLSEADRKRIAGATLPVGDEDLRAALARL